MAKILRYVINLDRRPDRFEEFRTTYGREDIVRFPGVDGRARKIRGNIKGWDRKLYRLIEKHPSNNREGQHPGLFGVWKSHLALWDMLLASNASAFVIFEDDIIPMTDFHKTLDKVTVDMDGEFDIIYLGGRFIRGFAARKFSDWKTVRKGGTTFYVMPDLRLRGGDYDRGLFAYIITRMGARKLIALVSYCVEKKIALPAVDEFINRNRSLFTVADVFPHICWSRNGASGSDIR